MFFQPNPAAPAVCVHCGQYARRHNIVHGGCPSEEPREIKPDPAPGVSGTFTQGGKEYDGATLFRIHAYAAPALYCPNRHALQAADPVHDLLVCRRHGCPFEGIVYAPQWPTVPLEAVQDAQPSAVEEKVTAASLSVAADIEAEEESGEWKARDRGPLGEPRKLAD